MAARNHEIVINKINRVWVEITIKGSKDFNTRMKKTDLPADAKDGDTVTVFGEVNREESRYGVKFEFVACDPETAKKEEATRWMGYLRERARRGEWYTKAYEAIKATGIKDFDSEIKALYADVKDMQRKNEIERRINRFRDGVRTGYINHRAVNDLHELDCHDYDDEIAAAKADIDAKKAEEAKKYPHIHLPAYDGFYGRPQKGEIIVKGCSVYSVISSYYHDADGWSFGVMCEEWYDVKALDITDTDEGQKRLEEIAQDRAEQKAAADQKAAENDLVTAIRTEGHKDDTKMNLNDVPGETIMDTMDVYGGGYIIRVDGDKVRLIVNNGADGDFWGINTIVTGGAGAYMYVADKAKVDEKLKRYSNVKGAK